LISTVLEFSYRRADTVSVYPSLYDKDVCIYAMRYSEKWMNIRKDQERGQQSTRSKNQPAAPGKSPTFLTDEDSPELLR